MEKLGAMVRRESFVTIELLVVGLFLTQDALGWITEINGHAMTKNGFSSLHGSW